MCLTEKNVSVSKLHSGKSYRAAGYEFNVNESTMHILKGVFKQNTNETRLCIDQLTKM